MKPVMYLPGLVFLVAVLIPPGLSIGCYKCKSGGRFGHNPDCISLKPNTSDLYREANCIPKIPPPPGVPNPTIYCVRFVGTAVTSTGRQQVAARGCIYSGTLLTNSKFDGMPL